MANNIVIVTIKVQEPAATQRVITIDVDKEPVTLDGYDGIEWQISKNSPEWTFTKDKNGQSDGITIKNHLGKFKDKKSPNATPANKNHQWERLAKDLQTYRYTISVTNETVAPVNQLMTLSWDPTIYNN
jgi:hypothetical protein